MIKLAKMLVDDKNLLYIYGQENNKELQHIQDIVSCQSLEEVTRNTKTVITSIPFSKNGTEIFSPFSEKKIYIKELLKYCSGKTLIAGAIKPEIYESAPDVKIIDIMKQEEVAIFNAVSTAEGAIKLAIENTEINLQGSNVLILGFGRIAKILAKKLDNLSSNVTCSARKTTDLAWIQAYGYNNININKLGEDLAKYDIIFNTVPHIILSKERLQYVKNECVIIELASNPGGVDKDEVNNKKLKLIQGGGLPGKVSPVTTALILKNAIYNLKGE